MIQQLGKGPHPQGVGLGAVPLINKPPSERIVNSSGEYVKLTIKKKAPVKILAGKHENKYGRIVGFDNGARVFVKLAKSDEILSVCEYCCHAVTLGELRRNTRIQNGPQNLQFSCRNANNQDYSSHEIHFTIKLHERDQEPSNLSTEQDSDERTEILTLNIPIKELGKTLLLHLGFSEDEMKAVDFIYCEKETDEDVTTCKK